MAFDPRHYKIPRTYQYSLGFQRQLPRNIVADIAFSGNLAIYGAYGLEELARRTGRAEPVRAGDAGFEPFTRTLANPFYGILPITPSAGSSPNKDAQSPMGYYPLWNGGRTNNLAQGQEFRFGRAAGADRTARVRQRGKGYGRVAGGSGGDFQQGTLSHRPPGLSLGHHAAAVLRTGFGGPHAIYRLQRSVGRGAPTGLVTTRRGRPWGGRTTSTMRTMDRAGRQGSVSVVQQQSEMLCQLPGLRAIVAN